MSSPDTHSAVHRREAARGHLRRAGVMACGLIGVALLGGCGSHHHAVTAARPRVTSTTPAGMGSPAASGVSDQPASTTTSPHPSATTVAAPPAASTPAAGPATSAAPAATTAPVAGGRPACTTSDLTASSRNEEGAGGLTPTVITLTDTSGAPCAIGGYPGVALLGADGQPLGAGLAREAGTATTITLVHGASVSDLVVTHPNACDAGSPPRSTYLQIIPPDQTTPLVVPGIVFECNGTVSPLQAGTDPAYGS